MPWRGSRGKMAGEEHPRIGPPEDHLQVPAPASLGDSQHLGQRADLPCQPKEMALGKHSHGSCPQVSTIHRTQTGDLPQGPERETETETERQRRRQRETDGETETWTEREREEKRRTSHRPRPPGHGPRREANPVQGPGHRGSREGICGGERGSRSVPRGWGGVGGQREWMEGAKAKSQAFQKPTAPRIPRIPRRSPIQVLTRPDPA